VAGELLVAATVQLGDPTAELIAPVEQREDLVRLPSPLSNDQQQRRFACETIDESRPDLEEHPMVLAGLDRADGDERRILRRLQVQCGLERIASEPRG